MSDKIAVMNHGRIEQFGTAHELYRRPKTRFVADFIGKSNILQGRVDAGSVFVTDGIRVPLTPSHVEDVNTGAVDLFIRPEDIRLAPGDDVTGDTRLPGKIAISTYSGDRALYTLTLPGGRSLRAYGRARDGALGVGTPVTVAFDAADCILLG